MVVLLALLLLFFPLPPDLGISARTISTIADMAFLASAPSTSSKMIQLGLPPGTLPLFVSSSPPRIRVDDSMARVTRSVNADADRSSLAFTSMGRYPACLIMN